LSQDLYQDTNRKNYNDALSSINLSQDLFRDTNRENYNDGLSSINLPQDLFGHPSRENYNHGLSSINFSQDLFRDTSREYYNDAFYIRRICLRIYLETPTPTGGHLLSKFIDCILMEWQKSAGAFCTKKERLIELLFCPISFSFLLFKMAF
jgi:hypothetical protein